MGLSCFGFPSLKAVKGCFEPPFWCCCSIPRNDRNKSTRDGTVCDGGAMISALALVLAEAASTPLRPMPSAIGEAASSPGLTIGAKDAVSGGGSDDAEGGGTPHVLELPTANSEEGDTAAVGGCAGGAASGGAVAALLILCTNASEIGAKRSPKRPPPSEMALRTRAIARSSRSRSLREEEEAFVGEESASSLSASLLTRPSSRLKLAFPPAAAGRVEGALLESSEATRNEKSATSSPLLRGTGTSLELLAWAKAAAEEGRAPSAGDCFSRRWEAVGGLLILTSFDAPVVFGDILFRSAKAEEPLPSPPAASSSSGNVTPKRAVAATSGPTSHEATAPPSVPALKKRDCAHPKAQHGACPRVWRVISHAVVNGQCGSPALAL